MNCVVLTIRGCTCTDGCVLIDTEGGSLLDGERLPLSSVGRAPELIFVVNTYSICVWVWIGVRGSAVCRIVC